LKKLFELEIPEIYDSIIEIKGIAREPGERAKVAVYSYDDRIDAVGACVGMKGIRIHSIVRELCNENIDVINFTDDIALYIARALAPAKLKDIYLDKDAKVAKIIADEDQISLIIGKNGQNIKLASKLTGYEIDVERKDIESAKEGASDEESADEEIKDEEVKDEETENKAPQEETAKKEEENEEEENEKEENEEESEENEEEVIKEEDAVKEKESTKKKSGSKKSKSAKK
jgi:N utilization substance protein A